MPKVPAGSSRNQMTARQRVTCHLVWAMLGDKCHVILARLNLMTARQRVTCHLAWAMFGDKCHVILARLNLMTARQRAQ